MSLLTEQDLSDLEQHGLKLTKSSNLFGKNIFKGFCSIGAYCDICDNVFGHFTCVGNHNSLFNCTMGNYSTIGNYVHITMGRHALNEFSTSEAFCENYIFDGYRTSRQNSVMQQYGSRFMHAQIGHDVLIQDHSVIPCDICIGDGALLEYGAVITKDVPAYAIVRHNNQIIGQRFSDEVIADLQASRWWNFNIPLAIKQGAVILDEPQSLLDFFKSTSDHKIPKLTDKVVEVILNLQVKKISILDNTQSYNEQIKLN